MFSLTKLTSHNAKTTVLSLLVAAVLMLGVLLPTSSAQAREVPIQMMNDAQLQALIDDLIERILLLQAELSSTDTNDTWTIEDVRRITYKYIDPNPQMADEEYYEYTVKLKGSATKRIKVCGFCKPGAREQAFYDAGFKGDVAELTDEAEEVLPETDGDDDTWTIDDVDSITSMFVDRIPEAADDEYTRYDIILTDGTEITVNECGFCPADARDDAFYDEGFTGDVDELRDMATEAKSDDTFCRSGDTWYEEGEQLNSLTENGEARDIVDGYFECEDGAWEVVSTHPGPGLANAKARIVAKSTHKTEGAVHGENIYFTNGEVVKAGEWFDLVEDGEFIKDDEFAIPYAKEGREQLEGLVLYRNGKGRVNLVHIGNGKTSNESFTGRIRVRNGSIIADSVQEFKFEEHRNSKYPDYDYVHYRNDTRVDFGTYVINAYDKIQFEVAPAPVGPAAGDVKGVSTIPSNERLAAALGAAKELLVAMR